MMKYLLLTAAALVTTFSMFVVPGSARAQAFNLQALQQQLSGSPAAAQASQGMQQMLIQQALEQLAANPQLLTQMASSLSAQQKATLTQQTLAAAQQVLTPAEQASFAAFTSSPEGASIASKMPQIMQQVLPVILQAYAGQASTVAPAAGK